VRFFLIDEFYSLFERSRELFPRELLLVEFFFKFSKGKIAEMVDLHPISGISFLADCMCGNMDEGKDTGGDKEKSDEEFE